MKISLLVMMLLCAWPAFAQTASVIPQSSLFLSEQETRDAEKLAEQKLPAGSANIRLGAVMYYGKDDWTLWLQNQRWTPQTTQEDLQVVDVTPTRVQITWRDDSGLERTISLKPNETYQIATGKIIP